MIQQEPTIEFFLFRTNHLYDVTPMISSIHTRIQRGIEGPDPSENHKNIVFLSNTGPDPLKITKLPSQHSMLGHHQHASETPYK